MAKKTDRSLYAREFARLRESGVLHITKSWVRYGDYYAVCRTPQEKRAILEGIRIALVLDRPYRHHVEIKLSERSWWCPITKKKYYKTKLGMTMEWSKVKGLFFSGWDL